MSWLDLRFSMDGQAGDGPAAHCIFPGVFRVRPVCSPNSQHFNPWQSDDALGEVVDTVRVRDRPRSS